MKGKSVIVLLCFLVLFQTTACNSQQTISKETAERIKRFESGIGQQNSNFDKSKNEGIRLGSVNMGMTSEWFAEVMNGIWDASSDMGVEVEMLDSANDLDLERQNIKHLVDEGIDALVISPRDAKDSIKNLKPAIDAGIPIITWNTNVNMDVDSFVCVDSNALGANTGDYLCEYIKTYDLKDVKLIIIDNKNYDVGIARCEGFKKSIKNMVDQNIISIVAEDDAETLDTAIELSENLLKEHPEANAIWGWNQPAVLGAIEAVKKTGRKDILIMGTDMSMELAKDMKEDDIQLLAITTQMPYNMGYKAVVTAVRAVNGEPVDKTVFIPLFTYKKTNTALVDRYILTHKNLIEWNGGNSND